MEETYQSQVEHGIDSPWGVVVQTKDGSYTIRNPEIDECYHCFQGALFEARFLYLELSGLQNRLLLPAQDSADTINLLDVGLGLGYNALSSIDAWLKAPDPPHLRVTSLEILASLVDVLVTGEAPWQSNWTEDFLKGATCLKKNPDGSFNGTLAHSNGRSTLEWYVLVGDAAQLPLPTYPGGYHYIWQDPFSPGKGPDMWSQSWFNRVAGAAAPGCRLMTFSVARMVKDNLANSGWMWKKIKGPKPGKRQWTEATWTPVPQA